MGGQSRSLSIRVRVLLLVAVLALPFVAVQLWVGFRELRHIQAGAEASVLARAAEVAASLTQFVSIGRRATEAVADSLGPVLLEEGYCRSTIPTIHHGLPQFVNLVVFDAQGDVVCGSVDGPISIADRPFFGEVRRTRTFTVSTPVVGRIVGTWVVGLFSPILGTDGSFLGAVAAIIELARLQEMVEGVAVDPPNIVSVGTVDGIVLARSEDAEVWVGRPLPEQEVRMTRLDGTRVLTRAVDLAGTERLWGRVEMPSTGWRVFVGVPEEGVRTPQLTHFYQQAAASLVALALAFIAAFMVQRGISRSLSGLTTSVRAVSGGASVPMPPHAPIEVVDVVDQLERTLAERDRARRVAQDATDRFHSIVENAVYGIFLTDENGRFLEVNRAMVDMLGYDTPQELTSIDLGEVSLDRRQWDAPATPVQIGTLLTPWEMDWRRKDGHPIRVRLSGKVVKTLGGVTAFEVMVEDVTRQRSLEEMTRHQQKMEAVGRLAGGVAHEFNNLLTVLSVNTDLIRGALGADDPLREEVDEIASAVERASAVTRRLLAFSRRDVTQPRVIGVNRIVHSLEGVLRRVLGDNVVLMTDLHPDAGNVLIDPGQLEQVLLNLVINARDALEDGGDVLVTTSTTETRDEEGQADASWTVIEVRDNGEGMDADMKTLIFEPFFTTKPPGRGTGLGLPTVYGIVTEAGGRVHVESEPGKGSSFEVWLPRSPHPPQDAS